MFSGLRQRFWASAPGRWLYRLAGLGLRRGELPAGAGNRPTEIVVGLAAEALYDALPREVRRALPDLSDVVRRLRATTALEHSRTVADRGGRGKMTP